jgi:hypothetical protein
VHPLWSDLQAQTAKLDGLGVYREFEPERLREERMLRLAISVSGYLKRMAAIEGLAMGDEQVTLKQAIAALRQRLGDLHDPLSWKIDVQRRMTEMRLGAW